MLTLTREMDAEHTHYINAFSARLTAGGKPVAGQKVLFRAHPVCWNADGGFAPFRRAKQACRLRRDRRKRHGAHGVSMFDGRPDIHFYYNIDVVFRPAEGSGFAPCDGPMMCVSGMTPHRKNRWPYDAYLAEGKVFLSPQLQRDIPDAMAEINALGSRRPVQQGELSDALLQRLLDANLLAKTPEDTFGTPASIRKTCLKRSTWAAETGISDHKRDSAQQEPWYFVVRYRAYFPASRSAGRPEAAPRDINPMSLFHIFSCIPREIHGISGAAAPKCAPENFPCALAAETTREIASTSQDRKVIQLAVILRHVV
ncbi:MAG: hypothetical protein R2912_09455 [Eubacteriales bacterium]